MAVKSIKFYNFQGMLGGNLSLNTYFYDEFKRLILMDFSTYISNSTNYCKTNEYIVTANGAYNNSRYYCRNSFHTGNTNKYYGLPHIGESWIPPNINATSSDWIKIEFKNAKKLSDIKVLHTRNVIFSITFITF